MTEHISYITRKDEITGEQTPPEGKRKVFISYKHSDEHTLPLCKKLASYILDNLDVAIWYDRQLTAGIEYDKEILSAIKQSDAFILLLTPSLLCSRYITEQEIPLAIQNQVAVVPVIAGMSEEDIPKVEKLIGRVHMPLWFFGKREVVPPFETEALKQFIDGVQISIASKDLLSEANLFYQRGNNLLSMRYLTPEQVFIKAYGALFGVDSNQDKSLGIRLMESILSGYESDKEFVDLQKQVSEELLKHLYRTNQPELFFACLKSAINKNYPAAYEMLFNVYYRQWHPEILSLSSELSMALFRDFYKKNFGCDYDGESVSKKLDESAIANITSTSIDFSLPRIGEIECDGYSAFFQRSPNETRTVNLVLNGKCVRSYEVYASFGDVYSLFLSYDSKNRILISLHSDFDHYGPETNILVSFYRQDPDGVRELSLYSDWQKGLRRLPFHPYTFGIK